MTENGRHGVTAGFSVTGRVANCPGRSRMVTAPNSDSPQITRDPVKLVKSTAWSQLN